MIPRRQFLIGATATLVSAPSIVRATNLMPVRSIIAAQSNVFGFVCRLRVDSLYRSGKLQDTALTHAIEQGLLDHVRRIPALTRVGERTVQPDLVSTRQKGST
jgi:hypothetical protein